MTEHSGAARGWKSLPWFSLTMIGALLLIWFVFTLLTDTRFLSPRNLTLLARQMSVTSILAMGMVLVIVSGHIDLSVGALAGFLGAVSARAVVDAGLPVPAAFAITLALGAALGSLQGVLVARLAIPAFIVTLGGMLAFQGALLGFTGGISTSPPPDYLRVGQAYLPPAGAWALCGLAAVALVLLALRRRGRRRWMWLGIAALGGLVTAVMNEYEGIPAPVLLVLALGVVLAVVAHHTPFGRHLYAIGGNRDAALYSGIRIERHVVGVFTLMGLLCAAAGIVLTARVGSATSEAGRMMELDAIAAAVIGGTSLLGGKGTVWGALLGACVMASLDNGMSLLNTEAFWQPLIKGAILVVTVAADVQSRRGRA